MQRFYRHVLSSLLESGALDRSSSVLAVCADQLDRDMLVESGCTNATISNLRTDLPADAFAPLRWERADVEELKFDNGSFDAVLVNAGLHHCRSPHRALLEMYRVARRLVLVIEARDSALMKLMVRTGFALEYETPCGPATNFTAGGVRNSPIPNYVYRWTERDVEKTIRTFEPERRPRIEYFYGIELHADYVAGFSPRRAKMLRLAQPLARVMEHLLPTQGNCFGFAIHKPPIGESLQPWLKLDGDRVVPNRDWDWK